MKYLLEEEMVSNELVLVGLRHGVESVELSGEVSLELVAGSDDGVHDLVALLVSDSWSEREIGEVTADSDTGGFDESGLLLGERWALKLRSVHVGDVLVVGSVLVVVKDDLVKEVLEGGVRVSRASVAADSGVDVLASREKASLEGDTGGIRLVVVLVPDFLVQESSNGGLLGALWELWPVNEVLWGLEVRSTHGSLGSLGDSLGSVAAHSFWMFLCKRFNYNPTCGCA